MNSELVDRHSELLSSLDVDSRLNGTKLGPNTVVVSTDSATDQELLNSQYMNLHRIPENLSKVQIVTDALPPDLLNHQVVELAQGSEFVNGTDSNQYYDDDLLPQDLTEEDKRLAAALVAVQLVQQQKQQHTTLLASEILNGKSMSSLSPLSNVSIDKPGMAAMVTSYMQAFDDETAAQQQLVEAQHHERILKMYQTTTPQHQLANDIRLPLLSPLKKVLSNQCITTARHRYSERDLLDNSVPVQAPEENRIPISSSSSPDELQDVQSKSNSNYKSGDLIDHLHTEETEEGDSDFEGENGMKSSRKSLPHKKRIPRKLKSQSNRSPHNKRHNSPPVKRAGFSCEICGALCINQAKFFEHLKAHYEPNSLQSTSSSFEPNKEVNPQQESKGDKIVDDKTNFSCGLCGNNFKRQKALETHIATAHPSQMEEFSEPEDLMEGIRHVVSITTATPQEENHQPDHTEKNRSNNKSQTHRWTQDDFTDFRDSEKTGSGEPELDEFGDEKGKKKKKLVHCPHCTRTFTHRNSLLYHVRSYTGKRLHQCEVCGKSFFAANALRVHMRMHSGDKPYKCEECGRNFRQWGDLKYHMTSIHSNTKQYQCEFCGKDFARKYSLIVHRRIHTGEKNYVCEFCRKTFRASSYLVNHRRIHTGEKPYSCDVCHKAFRVKSDMKRHRNIHNKPSRVPTVQTSESESVEAATVQVTAAPLDLNIRTSDDFRHQDTNTLYVWLPTSSEEVIEESILPD